LTAFAQLGTLRLGAQRAIISLFGRHEQHVLTEATRTLSLQDGGDHNTRDNLWIGTCTMSYDRSLCKTVANYQNPSDLVYVVPDLTQDDAYKDHPDVTGYPHHRFVACAPIISPKGIVIGAYTILDGRPRAPLSTDHTRFLHAMAATVMDYLITARSQDQHLRGERMIVGLGSFLEGKGSLRSSWLEDSDKYTTLGQDQDAEGHVNVQQQEKQRLDDMVQHRNSRTSLPSRLSNHQTCEDRNPHGTGEQARASRSTAKTRNTRGQLKINSEVGASNEQGPNGPRSNKETHATQVDETFARAANIVRESLEVEGVVFFDANFSSWEALVRYEKYDAESITESSASEEETKSGEKPRKSGISQPLADTSEKITLDPCKILGFATSSASSVNDEATGDAKIALSESFLGGLFRRYPQGKIFNFGEDGSISSGETSGSIKKLSLQGDKKYKRTRKSVLRQDAITLLNIAPESRSIIFSPVWDSHKSRWYAGTLAWTTTPQRVFTLDHEMAFCLTFGNSVMAEVHRLGALFAKNAISNLLAGISHELRSPLHGIFGTAELLNETQIDALQQGYVYTITSCARTLLGSISQLLEFSGINDVQPNRRARLPQSERSLIQTRETRRARKTDTDSIVHLDIAVEDTIETVFVGHSFLQNSHSPLQRVTSIDFDQERFLTLEGEVRLVVDIDKAPNWKFATRASAWHVILTNILGNALKYTQNGYIYISLKATPVFRKEDGNAKEDGGAVRSLVTLTVKDTGCGMSSDFLQSGYFTAFSQEDDIMAGNGLGASITHQTVSSLGGDIEVHSQKGIGTEVVVSLTLDHAPERTLESTLIDNQTPILPKGSLRQRTIGILGLGTSDRDKILSSSLRKLCKEWLEMDACVIEPLATQFSHCDFYIAPREYLDAGNMDIQAIYPDPSAQFKSPVIIMCSSPRSAHSMSVATQRRGPWDVFEFITQPCGPRKLAKALETCVFRQQQRALLTHDSREHSKATIPPALSNIKSQTYPASDAGIGRQPHSETANHTAYAQVESSTGLSINLQNSAEDVDSLVVSLNADGTAAEMGQLETPAQKISTSVLLVDDNDINVRLLVAYMKKLKYHYFIARNGQEALDCFKKYAFQISIILMGRS
jgi:signal transduction histidine kinase